MARRMPFGVTPTRLTIIVAVVVLALVTYVLGSLYASAQITADRSTRLYRLVTAPDAQERPMVAAPGVSARGVVIERPGVPTVIVVLSNLPEIASSEQYLVWFSKDGVTQSRQRVRLDADGIGRVTQEGFEPGYFDRIILGREIANAARQDGPVLLSWDRR